MLCLWLSSPCGCPFRVHQLPHQQLVLLLAPLQKLHRVHIPLPLRTRNSAVQLPKARLQSLRQLLRR